MSVLLFLIAVAASGIGAISGIGGGVIMKPLLDSTGMLTVWAATFMSGCTVLSMSAVSVVKNRKEIKNGNFKTLLFLSFGAALGGILGKFLFQLAGQYFDNSALGITQSVILIVMNLLVIFVTVFKSKRQGGRESGNLICLIAGLFLGITSAFLGIGGGPINIAVLLLLLPVTQKRAAAGSLFIIFCSQLTSLISTLITGSLPEFRPVDLIVMCVGGIAGAFIGGAISSKISEKSARRIFIAVTVLIMFVSVYNIIKFKFF